MTNMAAILALGTISALLVFVAFWQHMRYQKLLQEVINWMDLANRWRGRYKSAEAYLESKKPRRDARGRFAKKG